MHKIICRGDEKENNDDDRMGTSTQI